MAKRIQFARTGGPEVLETVEFEPVAPKAGEVRVKNHAIGLNFIDIYFRTGLYPAPSMPSGLGTEGAGVVDAVGEGVTHLEKGIASPTPRGRSAPIRNITCCRRTRSSSCRRVSPSRPPRLPCSRA